MVVMTSGHLHDLEIQEQIFAQELAYAGVIGSRAKSPPSTPGSGRPVSPRKSSTLWEHPVGT